MISYIKDTYADTLINRLSIELEADSIELDDEYFTCHVTFQNHVLTIRFNEPVDPSQCSSRSEFFLDNKFLAKGIKNPHGLEDALNDAYEALKEVRFII